MSIPADSIHQMIERTIELTRTLAIWQSLVDKNDRQHFANVVADHEDYFTTTALSLFQGFAVITYQLFERRRNTVSLPSLLKELASSNALLARSLQAEIDHNKGLLAKVFSLRGNVYAHRNKTQAPEAFFLAAALTPDEMSSALRVAQSVVAAIAEAEGVDSREELEAEFFLRADCAARDTKRILQCLAQSAP